MSTVPQNLQILWAKIGACGPRAIRKRPHRQQTGSALVGFKEEWYPSTALKSCHLCASCNNYNVIQTQTIENYNVKIAILVGHPVIPDGMRNQFSSVL